MRSVHAQSRLWLDMAEATYFAPLPFISAEDGLALGAAVKCFSLNAAVIWAESLMRRHSHIGAVAFDRTSDPAILDFEDAQGHQELEAAPDHLTDLPTAARCNF